MKNILLPIVIIISHFSLAQNPQQQKASVKVVDSVEIYMQSEPIAEYDVIGDVLPAGMNMHMDSMDHLCEHFIKRAQKKYPGVQFDALVFLNNWRAQVIRYRKNKS